MAQLCHTEPPARILSVAGYHRLVRRYCLIYLDLLSEDHFSDVNNKLKVVNILQDFVESNVKLHYA